jgi:hypothetical protein
MGVDVPMEKPKDFYPINNITLEEKPNETNNVSYETLYKEIKGVANKLLPPEDMKVITRLRQLTPANKAVVLALMETLIKQQNAPTTTASDEGES